MSSRTVTSCTEFTVNDAARHFKKDPSHIRRLCILHKIGDLKYGRVRILTADDFARLEWFFAHHGRNRGRRSRK